MLVPSAAGAHGGLPLGPSGLEETRSTDVLAPGVTYTKIVRGELSMSDGWTADVAIVATRAETDDLAQRLQTAGFDAHVSALPGPPDAPSRGAFACRVRSGLFGLKAQADERVAAIRAAGLRARGSVFTAEGGGTTSGPWVVHVLRVDPHRYRGRIAPTLANDVVADRETLSSLSARKGALAGINGATSSSARSTARRVTRREARSSMAVSYRRRSTAAPTSCSAAAARPSAPCPTASG